MKVLLIVAAVVLASAGDAYAQQTCLHGNNETPANRARRDDAIRAAIRINDAQHIRVVPNPRPSPRFRKFDELTNVPAIPQGFDLQFHTDGNTYSFSLKDRLDPCGYAIFSDQDRDIYEAVPRRGVVTMPLETN